MYRYALQWESDNLIAVSTAIQDWLTSSNSCVPLASIVLSLYATIIEIMDDIDTTTWWRTCTGVNEARGYDDCTKHTSYCIGLASYPSCSHWFHRQQMGNCYRQVRHLCEMETLRCTIYHLVVMLNVKKGKRNLEVFVQLPILLSYCSLIYRYVRNY